MCRIFSRGKIDMCRMGIFLKAVEKFFPFSIKMRWWIGICLMRSSHIFFHPSSYCPALFVHLPSGSSVMLRCVRRSEVFITHAAVSTAHSHMAACASLLSHSAVSHYYTTRARSLARSSIAHTLLFSSQCAHWFIYFYNDLFFCSFLCLESIARSVALPLSPWTSPQSGVGICRQPKVGITILRKCLIRSSSPGITEYESDLQMEEFQIWVSKNT